MRILLAALLAAGAAAAQEADDRWPALRCEAVARGAHATFELTQKGHAQMTIAISGGVVTCPLKLTSVFDRPKAARPEMGVDVTFDASACKPELPIAGDVLAEIVLRFALRGERTIPLGTVQWIKNEGPVACAVSAWEHAAVEALAARRQKKATAGK